MLLPTKTKGHGPGSGQRSYSDVVAGRRVGSSPPPTIVTQQEEEIPNITEFPPLTRNWHSPPPSPDTPPPIQPNNPPPEPLPLRTPRKPRDSSRKQNPAVADGDDGPDFLTINTCPTTHNTTEVVTPAHIQKQQNTTQDVLSQVVIIHPEMPNPQIIQEMGKAPGDDY
ncbi:hypothetical protein KOW79_012717 [Hemibagrus wyckioides]|uniref:Uncharacterized protein n=1 Tax=Hemibagrus wyckioides TaxID=337641 RepID=A0A9D3SGK2_9TELE|nr:hypothetical protein KOW79_012717 [Hemibagrus wyckioides]